MRQRLGSLVVDSEDADTEVHLGASADGSRHRSIFFFSRLRFILQRGFTSCTSVVGTEWVFLAFVGILVGTTSFVMDMAVEKTLTGRLTLAESSSPLVGYVIWLVLAWILALVAVAFTAHVSRLAIGSGIPEIKTILRNRGGEDNRYLSFRTLVSKVCRHCRMKVEGIHELC